MKTEWTQEPHTTVRWALVEALRASDNASTVDYWDVVTENLIRELKLRQEWAIARNEAPDEPFDWRFNTRQGAEGYNNADLFSSTRHVTTHLVSDWKLVDSDE